MEGGVGRNELTGSPGTEPRARGSLEGVAFDAILAAHGLTLRSGRPRVLQLNLGKRCNLTCTHCHVNAGPGRHEMMSAETQARVLAWQRRVRLPVVDLTGGAPEMVPGFRRLIAELRDIDGVETIIDRCNLTVLLEPGYTDLPEFFAHHRVTVVASMPCYSPDNVNAQRGDGVFDASIAALQRLNQLGYGTDPMLPLDLVYNPGGAYLPGAQEDLEADYKRALRTQFGIEFNRLCTITNMPIARFATWLRQSGRYRDYLHLLVDAFNPGTVDRLMCRDTINVSWRGAVYDCDFNQMLDLAIVDDTGRPRWLWELDPDGEARAIRTGAHCFGCTAGCGSSCGGALETALGSR